MLATALQLVLVMAALHLMALRHRLMSIFDPVDMINMPHLTHAYSNHYVLPPCFLFSVFESLICHVQNLDDGSSSVSNHDGAWKFGVCNTSRLRILIRYTHLRRIIIPVKTLALCLTAMFSVFLPTDICFPLSRDMMAVSTRLATMMGIATLGPEGPLGLKTWYDIHIFHVSSYLCRL